VTHDDDNNASESPEVSMFGAFKGQMKRGARLAALGLLGGVSAKVGGYGARRLSAGVASFAAEGDMQGALVDAGAGLVLDAVGIGIYAATGKGGARKAKAAAVAGPVIAGTLVAAAIEPVVSRVGPTLEGWVDKLPMIGSGSSAPAATPAGRYLPPGGSFSDGYNGGLPPAGAWSTGGGSGMVPAGNTSSGRISGLVPLT
jgi:hypothetical protein